MHLPPSKCGAIAGWCLSADFLLGSVGYQHPSSPIGSATPPRTPPQLGHAKMPHTALRPEDVRASAIAAQELREQHQQQESDPKQNQQSHNHISTISAISVPSLILIALFIRQAFDTSTLQRTLELFFRQYCMNATTFYCGLIDWVFGHVHLIMLILQSTATFSAFAWWVTPDAD